MAYHYSHSDNFDKAIEYLGRAGQQALQRSAHLDAIASLAAAIDLLPKLPEGAERDRRELRLQLALGPALIPIKGWAVEDVERAFTRSGELSEKLGESQALIGALHGTWAVYFLRGQLRKAHDLAEHLLRLVQSGPYSTLALSARMPLGDTLYAMGELLRAREQFEEVISLYFSRPDEPEAKRSISLDVGVSALAFIAVTLWNLGYPDQALKRSQEAISLAEAVSHSHSLVFALGYGCILLRSRREAAAAQEAANKVVSLSAEYGFTDFLPLARSTLGWALAQQGPRKDGVALMQEGLEMFRATGVELGRTGYLCRLAEALLEAESLDQAMSALTEAQTAADQREERECEPEILRLQGELLLKRDLHDAAEVEGCFERAIEIARKQSAKSWELRATTSLARLLASQGQRNEACTRLADIYNWFTEGFDTAD